MYQLKHTFLVVAVAALLVPIIPQAASAQQAGLSLSTPQAVFSSLADVLERFGLSYKRQTAAVSDFDVNLLLHYTFDEGSGTLAGDSSGNGNVGTLVNSPLWTTGLIGGAVNLDGTDDYIDLGTLDVAANGFTFSAWVRSDNLANCGSGDCRIISKAIGTAEQDHYVMLSTIPGSGGQVLRFRLKTGGTTDTLIASGGTLQNNTWAHVAATYDGSTMRLYQDGVEVGSLPKTGAIDTNATVSTWIGGNPPNATDRPWAGALDDVRIYDRALSASEVGELFNMASALLPPPAPVVTISASPTSITSGGSATLTWSSSNATSCSASGGWSGTKAISGTQTVSPTTTLTYTLTCSGGGGTDVKSVTVSVLSGSGTQLSQLAASLSPGQWGALQTTNINPVFRTEGASNIAIGFSEEIKWNPVMRQLQFVGSDHQDFVNCTKFVVYDESTNTWTFKETVAWAGCATNHGYDHMAVDPATGDLFSRLFRKGEVYKWDGSGWSPLPLLGTTYTSAAAVGIEYFPEMGGLIWVSLESGTNGSVFFWDRPTNSWSRLTPAQYPMGDPHNFAEYNPVHKVVVFGGGNGVEGRNIYSIDAQGTVRTLTPAPYGLGSGGVSIFTVDPVSGDYLVFFGNKEFWVYDVVSDTWTKQGTVLPTSLHTTKYTSSVFNVIAAPIADYGVNLFVTCDGPGNCRVNVYKHKASSIVPPTPAPAPTVTLSASPTSITSGGSATLTWSSSNATSCSASGGWSGTKATSGSESVSPTADTTYTLTCSGGGGLGSGSATVTVTQPALPPPSTKFSLGDRVQTTANLNVRGTPATAGALLGTQPAGSLGAVIGGPTASDGFNWWNVNYDNAPDGWSVEDFLQGAVVSSPPPPSSGGDFATLCSDPNVLFCQGFDTLPPYSISALPEGISVNGFGSSCPPASNWPANCPTLDNGTLKFTVPSQSYSSASGQYYANFAAISGDSIMPGETVFVRWQQRFSPEMLNIDFAGSGGWKQGMIGDPTESSCSTNELTIQDVNQRGLPQMYHACGLYEPLDTKIGTDPNTGSGIWDRQPGGSTSCPETYGGGTSFPPHPDCFKYFPGEWMQFQMGIDYAVTGNSRIRMWAARENDPDWTPIIDYSRDLVDTANGYGKMWLLPYQTGKDSSQVHPEAYTWYDELIVSKSFIPFSPGGGAPILPQAPTVTLSASPTSITSGGSATLTWSSSNATSCSASGGWSGTKATSGSESVSPTADTTYTLSCTGTEGSAVQSTTVTVVQPYQPSTDPVTHYTLDDGSGTIAADASGGGNAGTLVNGPLWTTGFIGGALDFSGNNHVEVADNFLTEGLPAASVNPAADFTLSAWVNLDNTSDRRPILSKQGTSAAGPARGFVFAVSNGTLQFEVFKDDTSKTSLTSTQTLTAGNWRHVAVTYDFITDGSSVIRLYLDGAEVGSRIDAVGPVQGNSQPLDMARYWFDGSYSRYLDGRLDDVRIYNRALTAGEIGGIYNMISGDPPPTPAPTVTLSASPASITSGGSATLTWSSSNATSCSASGGWSGTKATSGSESVSPTADTTYTLTCSGGGGLGSGSATVTVTQPALPPPSTKFSLGDRVQTTANLNVRGTPATAGALLGTQPTGSLGAVIGGPTASDGFNWWNVNYDNAPDGWSVEDFLQGAVVVPPTAPNTPPSVSAISVSVSDARSTVTGYQILEDTTVTYSATASDPDGDTLTWNWLYAVDGGTRVPFRSGVDAVLPVAFTYTSGSAGTAYEWILSVSDGTDTVERTFTVEIVAPLPQPVSPTPTVTLSASPASITSGQSATLTWSSSNATSCSASGGWSGTKATSGTQSVSPTADTTYTLTCSGGGGLGSGSAAVTVAQPVTSTTFIKDHLVETTAGGIDVRGTPTTAGALLGTQFIDAKGTVVGGPVSADGFTWWEIDYEEGADGWSTEGGLRRSTTVLFKPVFETGIKRDVTVTLVNPASGAVIATFTAAPAVSGSIEPPTNLSDGVYDIYVKAGGFLQRKLAQHELMSGTTVALPTLFAGDLNDDRIVNAIDWSVMNRRWNASDALADLNNDGIVNSLDFSSLRQNWNQRGDE